MILRKSLIDFFHRHQAKDRIAEKLQAFIGGKAGVGAGSVGESGAEQFGLVEGVADGVLAFFQNLGFAAGGQFLRHNGIACKTGGFRLKVPPPMALVNAAIALTASVGACAFVARSEDRAITRGHNEPCCGPVSRPCHDTGPQRGNPRLRVGLTARRTNPSSRRPRYCGRQPGCCGSVAGSGRESDLPVGRRRSVPCSASRGPARERRCA